MAHRKAPGVVPRSGDRPAPTATATPTGTGMAARPPLACTRIPSAPKVIRMDPSRSVRRTSAPTAARRSSVERTGCPYGFPVPAEATATRGRTRSTNASVVAVRLP
jgi:hypothetical protein